MQLPPNPETTAAGSALADDPSQSAPIAEPTPVVLHFVAAEPPRRSVWLDFVRHLVALIYPLALLASVVFLFATLGASGWLWLVVLVAVVLLFAAPKPPSAS